MYKSVFADLYKYIFHWSFLFENQVGSNKQNKTQTFLLHFCFINISHKIIQKKINTQ